MDVQIKMQGESQDYIISVLDAKQGTPLNPDAAQQILVLIREFAA